MLIAVATCPWVNCLPEISRSAAYSFDTATGSRGIPDPTGTLSPSCSRFCGNLKIQTAHPPGISSSSNASITVIRAFDLMSGASNQHRHRIFRAAANTRSKGVLLCVATTILISSLSTGEPRAASRTAPPASASQVDPDPPCSTARAGRLA